MRKLAIAGLAMLLTSCGDTYSGRISVLVDLLVTSDRGVREVKAGDYNFDLKLNSRTRAELVVKTEADQSVKLKYKLSSTSKLPQDGNGEIFISGRENSQNFDIVGTMTTTHTDGEVRSDWQSCTYRVPIHECFADERGRVHCYTTWEETWGEQRVEYFVREFTENLAIDLKLIDDSRVVGQLASGRIYREQIDIDRGICR